MQIYKMLRSKLVLIVLALCMPILCVSVSAQSMGEVVDRVQSLDCVETETHVPMFCAAVTINLADSTLVLFAGELRGTSVRRMVTLRSGSSTQIHIVDVFRLGDQILVVWREAAVENEESVQDIFYMRLDVSESGEQNGLSKSFVEPVILSEPNPLLRSAATSMQRIDDVYVSRGQAYILMREKHIDSEDAHLLRLTPTGIDSVAVDFSTTGSYRQVSVVDDSLYLTHVESALKLAPEEVQGGFDQNSVFLRSKPLDGTSWTVDRLVALGNQKPFHFLESRAKDGKLEVIATRFGSECKSIYRLSAQVRNPDRDRHGRAHWKMSELLQVEEFVSPGASQRATLIYQRPGMVSFRTKVHYMTGSSHSVTNTLRMAPRDVVIRQTESGKEVVYVGTDGYIRVAELQRFSSSEEGSC